jgi:MFS family permease
MVIPAIPDLISEFHISYSLSSWILTSYLIAGAVMTPFAGKLSDIYGRKRVLLYLMIIYTFGLLIGAVSNSFALLITSRIIQGIGISMFSIAFTMILNEFPKKRVATAQGIISAAFSGGAVIGLAIGGTIIDNFGWRATFLSVIPLSVFIIAVINKVISDKLNIHKADLVTENKVSSTESRILLDFKGVLSLTATITTFLLALTFLDSIEQNLYIIIILAIASIASLFMFIYIEKKSTSPLIDLKLLKDRIILPANIVLMFIGCILFMTYQTIAIMIKNPPPSGFGGSSVDVAHVQLPFIMILFIVSIISGFLISRLGNVRPTIIGTVISSIGFFILFAYHDSEILIAMDLLIIAIGISFAEVGVFNITTQFVPKQYSGISIGITTLLFLVGMSIGPAIAGMFLEQHRNTTGSPSSEAYDLIFLSGFLISAISIPLTIIVTKRVLRANSISIKR